MATLVKFNQFVEDLAKGVHNLASNTLKVYLSNATPDVAADAIKADLAEISAGNGYTAGGVTLANVTAEQTSGTLKLICDDFTIAASGGPVGPFRYFVLYNDTPTSPADPLIGYLDYGSSITLADGEDVLFDASAANGILQAA